MPYIKENRRSTEGSFQTYAAIDKWLSELGDELCAGDLNYILSTVIHKYTTTKGLCYQTTADVSAAMAGALHEYNRNIVDPYEDKKKLENGSVSKLDAT